MDEVLEIELAKHFEYLTFFSFCHNNQFFLLFRETVSVSVGQRGGCSPAHIQWCGAAVATRMESSRLMFWKPFMENVPVILNIDVHFRDQWIPRDDYISRGVKVIKEHISFLWDGVTRRE